MCGLCVVQGDGRTALISASQNGHVETVCALLDAGAAVNQAAVSEDGEGGYISLCVSVCEVGVW